MQQVASAAYLQAEAEAGRNVPVQLLNRQSQAMAALLLDYQLRQSLWVNSSSLLLDVEHLRVLDQAIEMRFDEMQAAFAQQATALGKIRGQYQFVRSLLQTGGRRSYGGAEFYLSRAVLDLDELAMAILQAAP
ncbi:hypothetical protein [Pseudomonas zhanjiangensis]|uniref:Outer membrane efflux protein n=1 Tax=Pseudomonas zhanjiangensis TaxID=3239015 RepID=A0ABV3YZS4_9PSED